MSDADCAKVSHAVARALSGPKATPASTPESHPHMRHTRPNKAITNHRAAIVLTVLLAGLASGCDRDAEARKAIDAANVQLATLTSGLGSSPTAATRDKVYTSVTTSLSAAAGSDRAAYAASANILLAKAHAGLAETPAATAASIESDSLNRSRVIRADLAQWLEMSAIAQAAERYDPSGEIAQLDSQIKQIADAIAGLTRAREQVSARHKALTSEASDLNAQAATIRNAIGELRIRSTTVTATEAAAISERIREQSRNADALERRASEILAEASPIVPQIEEIDLNIAGLNNQTSSLRAAQAAALQRGKDAKTEAAEARALASAAAQRLDTAVNELVSLREGDLTRAYEQALRSLSTSSTAARKAANDNRTGAKLAEGTALQISGDLLWQQAHGLAEHHALMSSLASASPDLPRSGAYAGIAASASTARSEALLRAAEAYEQAKNALTSAGAKGETSTRLERVGRMLDLIIQATQGQEVDWAAAGRAPAPMSESFDESSGSLSGETPDLASTIQGWLDRLNAGDGAFISSIVYSDIPALNAMMSSMGDLIVKGQRLDALCAERFGQSLTDFASSQAQGMPGVSGLPDLGSFSAQDLDIQTVGDRAELTLEDGTTLRFRMFNDGWKLDLSQNSLPEELAMVVPMLDQLAPIFPAIASITDELIAETQAGAYVSTQAVYIAQQQKMMPIMLQIMGSMQPPGGG